MIALKRAYEPAAADDGHRVLVERLWPRGVSKGSLRLESWLREVAPSPELRRWFGHDPARWNEFRRRYFRELSEKPEAWQPLLQLARRGRLTLVFGARDVEHNNAVALREFLQARLARKASPALPALLLATLCTGACTPRPPAPPTATWERHPPDEPQLMEQLRMLVKTDPASAVGLAAQGDQRFPNSRFGEERDVLSIRALARLGWTGAARARAQEFLARYPHSSYATEMALLGGLPLPPP